MNLNEKSGYFHEMPGWNQSCAVTGAVLADLPLLSRMDSDPDSLHLLDAVETGDPALDLVPRRIADEPDRPSSRYWIERFAIRAESVIDNTLDRLADLKGPADDLPRL